MVSQEKFSFEKRVLFLRIVKIIAGYCLTLF